MDTVIVRPFDFKSDEALTKAIENLFGFVWQDSKRAWEEIVEIRGVGLTQKPEGMPVPMIGQLEQGYTVKVIAKTYTLSCTEPEDSNLVRAILYGAVSNAVSAYPKSQLQMHWRRRPVTEPDNDFDTLVNKYRTCFRIGAFYTPKLDTLEGAIVL